MGRFVVAVDGVEISPSEFGGRKVRTVIRLLATRRGRFMPTDVIVDLLWPDRPPADPAANLQVLVNRARRAVRAAPLIVTGPGGYALTQERFCTIDTERFLAAAGECAALTGPAALTVGKATLALYHGDPLAEDRYAAWAEQYRNSILRAHQQLLERTATLALSCGEISVAIDCASEAVAAEPLRESAALALVSAVAAAGDRAGALRHYDSYRRILAAELGLDPSPDATALQARLLAGSYRPATTTSSHRGSEPVEPLRFVGRDVELERLQDSLSTNGNGVHVIAGTSGAGKSRLLAQLVTTVPAVTVRAYWPHRVEPWSLARDVIAAIVEADIAATERLPGFLRSALASIVPELADDNDRPIDPESRRALVIQAGVRMVAAKPGIVLVVDDLQWADDSSIQLLAALADRGVRTSMVLAYRPEEIEPDSGSASLLRYVRRTVDIELGGLSRAAIAALIPDPPLAAALLSATDRTPIAVSEVLRALHREGLACPDNDGNWRPLAATAARRAAELGALGKRAGIARRVDRHTGLGARALHLLALAGRQVAADTVATASGVEEQAINGALSRLGAGGLARLGERGWTTTHDMVRDVVVDRLDPTERRRLHAALAGALTNRGADEAEVARHWSDAGDPARAAEAFRRAAAAALDSSANAEAEQLADAGLQHPVDARTAAALHFLRAQARRRRGRISGAREDLRTALTTSAPGPERARILAELAIVASGSDDLLRASELVELALVEVNTGPIADARTAAHCLEVASIIDMNLAQPQRSRRRAAEALKTFQQLGDSHGTARILDARAMATFLDGDIRYGTEMLHRAANLFEDCGDLMRLVTPRSTRGHGLVFLGEPDRGLADASAALEVARRLDHPEGQSYALWHRSEALSALGRPTEAEADGRQALAIATSIGHRGWTATAWRAIGIAQQTMGDAADALQSFRTSLENAEHFDLFASWAAARSALTLVSLGRCDDAEPLIVRALREGPPLARYEARLAQVEAAAARSDPTTGALATRALARAEAGGMLAHRARLSALIPP